MKLSPPRSLPSLGWEVDSADAEIVLSSTSGAVELARSVIGGGRVNENYRVMLPLDQNRSGKAYKPGAVEEACEEACEDWRNHGFIQSRSGTLDRLPPAKCPTDLAPLLHALTPR